MRSARTATEQNLARMQARITQLSERQNLLNSLLASAEEDPLVALEAGLQQLLAAKLDSDGALRAAREQLDGVEHRLREHEQARHRHDVQAQAMRDKVQDERMSAQEVLVRLKTLDEQLAEHDYQVARILETLSTDASVDTWAAQLETLERQIQRLGPINLAAIDELSEQSQRKQYLDEQHRDVTEALATLERAIAKIDRETRSRFKDTFEKVNAKVEEFFPRLFGGGHGALQMTGDDLLSTGVSVNAQPPGKRVSNIQLLSGGEKALTAVALVFAFFELNPSPFCMLDEVDAPLDDANVGRFCELVKEMSERVQFIFITHNKVTMEMAEQLMGVTMNEPGVSRLVTVDVSEAVELAGA
jgi:chromosome segregation protein